MKKLLKLLFGDAFIKSIIFAFANQIFDKIILWVIVKLRYKIVARQNKNLEAAFDVITQELLDLKVEDFIKENNEILNKISHDL